MKAMIHYVSGSLFDQPYDAIVNAVNCVGVMGKGLALEFKNRYPDNYNDYRSVCLKRALQPGRLHITHFPNEPIIINFATKDHWRNPSELSYIKEGAALLALYLKQTPEIKSIAIPKLGCGLGGLSWSEVRPILEKNLSSIRCDIYLFGERNNE